MELNGISQLIGPLSLVALSLGFFSLPSGPSSLKHLPTFVPETGRGIFGNYQNIGVVLVINQ